MSWSGWERLDLDNANDFIMPFVFQGDLHVAWPVITKTTRPNPQDTDPNQKENPLLFWDVQIAWSRLTSRGWTKRILGEQVMSVKRLVSKAAPDSFSFRLRPGAAVANLDEVIADEAVYIDCYVAETVDPPDTRPRPTDSLVPGNDQVHFWVNVSLRINWSCWGEFIPVGETTPKYEILTDVVGMVNYRFGYTGGGYVVLPLPIPANGSATIEMRNADEFTVTFFRPGSPDQKFTHTLKKDNGEEYSTWTLDLVVIFKIPNSLQGNFKPDRPVIYKNAGAFGIDVLHDISLTQKEPPIGLLPAPLDGAKLAGNDLLVEVKGNSFRYRAIRQYLPLPPNASTQVDHDALGQLMITPSSGRMAQNQFVWYLNDGVSRYYLQYKDGRLQTWSDGQDFVDWYRRRSVVAIFDLFSPNIQAQQSNSNQTLASGPSILRVRPQTISFATRDTYANYNWELFLHVPLAMASYLAAQQRFEDARRWLHAVFDPTTADKDKKTQVPNFWRFLPFSNKSQPESIAKLLTWLADPVRVDPENTQAIEDQLKEQIEAWKKNPFMPHLVARLRPSAYQWYTFFAYLDVLIGWGDRLFRRDTRESVNAATLLYVLAAKLLSPRPRVIPQTPPPPVQTYRSLLSNPNGLDAFSNIWLDYTELPGIRQVITLGTLDELTSDLAVAFRNSTGQPRRFEASPNGSGTRILTSLSSLAFCIPQNEKLTEYYDLIEKRLYDVRNCRNIDGVFRELPLYDPPIDPLLLIRARAAGLDIDSVLSGLYEPLSSPYRFTFRLQRALELTSELKALGSALLTSLEKQDGEELALLRSRQEIDMLKRVRETRQKQVEEADANLVALRQSEETLKERFAQYQKLLGNSGITMGQDGLPVVEQSSSLTVSTDAIGGVSGLGLSRMEVEQLHMSAAANELTQVANSIHLVSAILSMFPDIFGGTPFAGQTFGGSNLGLGANATAQAFQMGATHASYFAGLAGTFGSYERRQDEWVHQSKLALAELKQLQKQIIAAEIRKAIADRELENHDLQVENAQAVDEFMHSKFTNLQLHQWMSTRIAEVYFRTYQLALDQARLAERTCRLELGLDAETAGFIRADAWDSLKRGLLAGEHLHYDLKRMESAYLERNTREFELTKHVSLLLLDPQALIRLRETGSCSVTLPEELFDLDYPGHYFRRIKSVSITLPCVAGPYTTIACTLRLMKNSFRVKTTDGDDGYPHNKGENGVLSADERFIENKIPVKAIGTSSAQNDSGMFEVNFRDERYLPFEGAGVISTWSIELFNDTEFKDENNQPDFGKPLRQFDYTTISDVILHIRYTARDGGTLKKAAIDNLRQYFTQDGTTPGLRMFNLRQEFPTQWHRFLHPVDTASANVFQLELGSGLFPWRDNRKTIKINTICLLARCMDEADYKVVITPPISPRPSEASRTMILSRDTQLNIQFGELHFSIKNTTPTDASKRLFEATIDLSKSPQKWQFTVTGPGPDGQLREDPETKKMEIEDLILVLGYEWEST
jgi:hypothetical protein